MRIQDSSLSGFWVWWWVGIFGLLGVWFKVHLFCCCLLDLLHRLLFLGLTSVVVGLGCRFVLLVVCLM